MTAHDLLWPSAQACLRSASGVLPEWLNCDWPAVMRRAPVEGAWLPVGLRGPSRSLRHAAFLHSDAVARCTTPESLINAWQQHPALLDFASVATLKVISAILLDLDLPWGPTGSTGFALATGYPVLRSDSDLDLLVRAALPLTAQQIALLGFAQSKADALQCRLDIQVDTAFGGFALNEWLRAPRQVLLKTDAGPMLTDDPWSRVP
ncbi:phosphoribosyl-dephospho-CoA transferase [Oxalobacteraceae bacterium GrIS 2.11]